MISRIFALVLLTSVLASPAFASGIRNNRGDANFTGGCNVAGAAGSVGLAIGLAGLVPLLARRRTARV